MVDGDNVNGRMAGGLTVHKFLAVVNDKGLTFCGISKLSGRAVWLPMDGDVCHTSECEALRTRRHTSWLEMAKRSDNTAQWKEL